ncbi:MAG: hypothetical protein JXM75_06725 [Chromatiaceae bacterium]|nr:hypothetical protein [Chromatiaceae bacterium]
MKTVVIVLASLLVGSAIGGVFTLGFGAGMGAASGLVTGSQAGICLAADVAAELELADPETLERLVDEAIGRMREKAGPIPLEAGLGWIEGREGCALILERI